MNLKVTYICYTEFNVPVFIVAGPFGDYHDIEAELDRASKEHMLLREYLAAFTQTITLEQYYPA